jgi:transposase
MFADEARFGRMNRIGPCWAPVGTRPAVAAQLIREYIYLYGAVSPRDGTCVYLIMPTSSTASFQVFLQVLARRFTQQDILLVLDGAPNHRCGDLTVPDNITLLYLPPYSPELNPKENLWDEIREKGLQELCPQYPWMPCAPSLSRPSFTSNAIPSSSAPLPPSPISSTHSDEELVLGGIYDCRGCEHSAHQLISRAASCLRKDLSCRRK